MFYAARVPEKSTDGDRPPSPAVVPLDQLLAAAARDPAALDPALVRAAILAEHRKIRAELARLEAGAASLLACSLPMAHARRAIRQRALQLCGALWAHVAFENQVLVPVIARVDAWGPQRAERLLAEHAEQLQLLRTYVEMLASHEGSAQAFALSVWRLVETIREDMRDEEAELLSRDLLEQSGGGVETG